MKIWELLRPPRSRQSATYYQRYIDLNPRDADIYFQMAIIDQKHGKKEKALSLYKKSIELDSSQLVSHLALADLYEEMKSTAQALGEYRIAMALQPENPLVAMRLGNLYYHDGQWDDAWAAFQTVQKASPQDPTVYYWLAADGGRTKGLERGSQECGASLHPIVRQPISAARGLLFNARSPSAKRHQISGEARHAIRTTPMCFFFSALIIWIPINRKKPAKRWLAGSPNIPKTCRCAFILGMAEDRLGHFDAAIEQFQAILTLDPKNAAAMNYIGYSWADCGIKLDEAEKLLRQAVALDPESGAYLDSWDGFSIKDEPLRRVNI